MFYWKYIHIDDDEIKSIQKEYTQVLPNNDYFFQSLELPIKTFLGLEVQRFVLIQVEPNATGRIHTDWRPTEYGYQLAIQIPLLNCDKSTTSIWSSDYTPPTQYTTNGQPYNYYEPTRCIKVTEFRLTQPVLWRTDLPHSVDNPTSSIRRAISVRFKQDPWHLV
jgi:hypothetical protein